jgi:hypothetical protein
LEVKNPIAERADSMSESNEPQREITEELSVEMNDPDDQENQSEGWFETIRGAALAGKAAFPDQIDYYDPEEDEIV